MIVQLEPDHDHDDESGERRRCEQAYRAAEDGAREGGGEVRPVAGPDEGERFQGERAAGGNEEDADHGAAGVEKPDDGELPERGAG